MGKGGSSTSVEIPQWLEDAARRNLGQADKVSRVGPVPLSYGPTVADFTDSQYSAFNNNSNMARSFGMQAPDNVAMGNPAATTYSNGVRAISAGPLYDAKMDAFSVARPGQKSYIDSFFIDPFSGEVGSNVAPTVNYGTETFEEALARANSENNNTGLEFGPAVLGASSEGLFGFGDNYNRTFNRDMDAATEDAAANPFGTTAGTPIFDQGYVGVSDDLGTKIKGGFNKSPIGKIGTAITDEPMFATIDNLMAPTVGLSDYNPDVSIAKDPLASGKSVEVTPVGPDDGTVMCTAYYEMGKLPADVWSLDKRYGVKMYREDPLLIEGYHMWGVPVANFIRKQNIAARACRFVMWPIVKAWAEEMAHCMKPEKYKPNYFGKAIKFVGEPFSRLVGKLGSSKVKGVA